MERQRDKNSLKHQNISSNEHTSIYDNAGLYKVPSGDEGNHLSNVTGKGLFDFELLTVTQMGSKSGGQLRNSPLDLLFVVARGLWLLNPLPGTGILGAGPGV